MEAGAPAEILQHERIFNLFREQLKKDFESAGWETNFLDNLSVHLESIKKTICQQLMIMVKCDGAKLSALLYRVDISEQQIKKYSGANPKLNFEDLLTELIIKRILQKVIIKESYGKHGGGKNS